MAEANKDDKASAKAVTFTEVEQKKARAWFEKAADCRERREYDYAIECIITGLGFWPEAVEDGHMPLRSLAIQRQQVGGKKPGMGERLKKSTIGRDPKQCMLNAEFLLAKDPTNAGYVDSLLKNATKAGYLNTVNWVAPLVMESLRRDKKPDRARFKAYRAALVESAERADAQEDMVMTCQLLQAAVESLEYLLVRMPGDEDLRIEQRDLAGKLAIARGKYEDADTFRDSLQDAEQQKLLHDADRSKQAEDTYEAVVAAARKAWEAEPTVPKVINALVDALLRREVAKEENEAVVVLMKAYEQSNDYSYKVRADDVRLRQLARQTRRVLAQARESGAAEDAQQARLARLEELQTEMEVYRERVDKYPTDLRLKYRLGRTLFAAKEYDEAIPVLQIAQGDPRSRRQCQLLIGRAFYEKQAPAQAVEVLKELLTDDELSDDQSREAMYWQARALEADGRIDDARSAYGKLLRQDYNYADGDARRRMEALK
ncbi:MAG: hypothetical protein PVJ57_01525 [Phycisphaerae bacterium]